MSRITELQEAVERRVWGGDVHALSRPRRAVVYAARLAHVVGRELFEGNLTLWAMSLVYTTLLSLVPLLAVSLSILMAFGVQYQIEPVLYNVFAPLGPQAEEVVHRIIGFIDNIRVGVLGSIGVVTLLYLVVSLIQKMEEAFNEIWQIQHLRRVGERVSAYLSVILVGPVLIFSAVAVYTGIMATDIMQRLLEHEPLGGLLFVLGQLLPYVLVAGGFTSVYFLVPNTGVAFRSALVGGLVAALLWQVSGWLFAAFMATSTRYEAIYSGLAILLLFMFWLYVSWIIVLIGAYVSFYFQYPQFLVRNRDPVVLSNRLKERLALLIMYAVAERYYANERAWTLDSLSRRLEIPSEPLCEVLDMLEREGLLIETNDEPPSYFPGRDLENVSLQEFLTLVRTAEEQRFGTTEQLISSPEIDQLLGRIDTAIGEALRGETFKTLVNAARRGSRRASE
jgi:membrane protein